MKADEQAIHKVLERSIVEAWNANDAEAFGAFFTEDADYIVYFGKRLQGREAIVAEHREVFATFLKGSKLYSDVTDVRFLSPGIAVAHTLGTSTTHGGRKPPASRNAIQTFVLVKQPDGAWRITAFQNTRIKSMKLLMFLARFMPKK